MNQRMLCFAALAALPFATVALWFPIVGTELPTTALLAVLGGETLVVLAVCWRFLSRVDRMVEWAGNFRIEDLDEAPPGVSEKLFAEVYDKILECDDQIRSSRRRHRKDLETVNQWINNVQSGMGLPPEPAKPNQDPIAAFSRCLDAGLKQFQALRTRCAFLQKTLHAMPAATLVLNEQGQVKSLNQKAEALFGKGLANHPDAKLDKLLNKPDNTGIWKDISRAAQGIGSASAITAQGAQEVRYSYLQINNGGRDPLVLLVLWERSAELDETRAAILGVRASTTQKIIRENLLVELPLLESLNQKSRLLQANIKQRAERATMLNGLNGLQHDLDQLEIRLRLTEWLYRTEWVVAAEAQMGEVFGQAALNDAAKKFAALFAARRLNLNITNNGGWLSADQEVLQAALLGLLHFGSKAAAGRLDVIIEKLPPSSELPEGWISFSISGEWSGPLWDSIVKAHQWTGEELVNDTCLGFAVAVRAAHKLQGVCRAEKSADQRRSVRLSIPTRLPGQPVAAAEDEVGPKEELCLGWKLATAI